MVEEEKQGGDKGEKTGGDGGGGFPRAAATGGEYPIDRDEGEENSRRNERAE